MDGGAKTKSYKQYLEIEIARRRNGRVDRPGLDDDNATSLKHGNEAFLDYMLDSVFVGSKWINWLVEPVIAYAHSPPHQRNHRNQILFQYLRDKKKKRNKGAQKKGGGGENSPISPPLDPRLGYSEEAPTILGVYHHSYVYQYLLTLVALISRWIQNFRRTASPYLFMTVLGSLWNGALNTLKKQSCCSEIAN